MKSGISEDYASNYWDKTLIPFADYSFNKSHACAYSLLTYVCAYFKANYPTEFFCALMTTRSQVMPPKDWAEKAPEYIQEAKALGVNIHSPSVQTSETGFTIVDKDIYFGLSGIRGLGAGACKALLRSRQGGRFKDIWDFIGRCDQRVVNTKVLEALIISGAFDTMGYHRQELREKLQELAGYLPALQEYLEHTQARKIRDIENERIELLRAELDEKVKEAKKLAKESKKTGALVPEELKPYLNIKETFELIASALARENVDPMDLGISTELIDLYTKYGSLRKLPALKEKEEPVKPELTRSREVYISVEELMEQAEYIGCFLGEHPARIIFPHSLPIARLIEEWQETSGQVTSLKIIKTRKTGEEMAFLQLNDGTASAEVVVFAKIYAKLVSKNSFPVIGDIVQISGHVENIEPVIKMKADNLILHRRNNGNM